MPWRLTLLLIIAVLLGGCQRSAELADLERLVLPPDLPVPSEWMAGETEHWESETTGSTIEERWTRRWGRPDSSTGGAGVYLYATHCSSPTRARSHVRAIMQNSQEHGCRVVDPKVLFAYDCWADQCVACQNRENQGMTSVIWRYRNIVVTAHLQESRDDRVADLQSLFVTIDKHLQETIMQAERQSASSDVCDEQH